MAGEQVLGVGKNVVLKCVGFRDQGLAFHSRHSPCVCQMTNDLSTAYVELTLAAAQECCAGL